MFKKFLLASSLILLISACNKETTETDNAQVNNSDIKAASVYEINPLKDRVAYLKPRYPESNLFGDKFKFYSSIEHFYENDSLNEKELQNFLEFTYRTFFIDPNINLTLNSHFVFHPRKNYQINFSSDKNSYYLNSYLVNIYKFEKYKSIIESKEFEILNPDSFETINKKLNIVEKMINLQVASLIQNSTKYYDEVEFQINEINIIEDLKNSKKSAYISSLMPDNLNNYDAKSVMLTLTNIMN